MAIVYEKESNVFTINTKSSTYQMKVDTYGVLLHLYYGAGISGRADYLLSYSDRGFSGSPYDAGNDRTYSLDALPQEYPCTGTGDYRNSALIVRNGDGSYGCDLRYVSYKIKKGKYGLRGLPAVYAQEQSAETLEILLEDTAAKLQVCLLYGVLEEEDIITRSVEIKNGGTDRVLIEKAASACLDFLAGSYDLLSFYGRHAMERNYQRMEIVHGCYSIGSRRGTSSHQYNPSVVIADRDATENAGNCYGMLFAYSGNFSFEAEKDQFGQTRVIMGMQDEMFSYPLEPQESLIVPETILAFSGKGFSQLSRLYHNCIREHIVRGRYKKGVRPVLVNSWEAAYFDFTAETIYKLAQQAVRTGIDMVVMDDGWFGNRNDDNCGLGDWYVNEEKLGCTLGELIGKINALGVKFGIWIEPEMISEDSRLYREHPDWILCNPGRKPVRSRNQLVLDFSREDVRTGIFNQICRILEQGNIEYIKWDMNRSLSDICSAVTEQGKITYQYVLGVYDFLEKLIQKYPDILIEGCSGGGGRFDAGMLYYTPQIWCSDNTDALDRIKIQYGTSFFYPAGTVASHVSAVPNHQTGRSVPIDTRGVVAMAGIFGYELDLSNLSEEEVESVRNQVVFYKENADLIQNGDYYRLTNPFRDEVGAWMFVSKDKQAVLVSAVMLEIHGNMTANYVKLRGLEGGAVYRDMDTGAEYSGSLLMEAGILLPVMQGDYQSYQMKLQKCMQEKNA